MSQVSLQADVGSLGIRGLGAFTSVLATLSADNIVPMALIQMEQLGTNLPVNGKLAEDIKALLQRCKDVRLDHFAFFVGWRKNDSASLMAESAGGQAIALLSVCLKSLFRHPDIGIILMHLCSRLCPRPTNVSSVSQLADVASLLASKADALGFGNLLAKEVAKIYDVYRALGRPSAPAELLENLSTESTIEVLEKVSQALCQDSKICRISGYRAMGHIVGLIRALFPHDLVLTVEGVVVQDVERPKIRCEIIDTDTGGMTRIYLETSISNSTSFKLPIERFDLTSNNMGHDTLYSFKWSTWLTDYLRLIFLNYGLMCNESIIQACCDFLVLVPSSLNIHATITSPNHQDTPRPIPPTKMLALLGSFPRARICLICKLILGCTPTEHHLDLPTAFAKLVEAIEGISDLLICACPRNSCDWSKGWFTLSTEQLKSRKKCQRLQLWNAIGSALESGLWSFFIDAGPNVTIRPRSEAEGSRYITRFMKKDRARSLFAEDFLGLVSRLINDSRWSANRIITSSGSCTLYPTVLKTMEIPPHQLVTFTVVEGQIVHEHRYHRYLCAADPRVRPKQKHSLMDRIVPSHIGDYSGSPLLTIREGYDSLELHISIEYARNDVKLNLTKVILGYIGMQWTSMCAHSVTKPMNPSKWAIATSVASPATARRLGVAMTRWNPIAQFLCCEYGYQAVLQKECCLDCAAEMFGTNPNGVIIVG